MKTNRMLTGALFALAMGSALIARADDKPVTLARTYKEGETSRYKTTVTASVMGMDVVVNTTQKGVVKEIRKNGDVVIIETSEGGTINVAGTEQEQPATPPSTFIRSKTGKLVELKADEAVAQFMAPEIQKLAAMTNEVLFPEKAVKPGETWETSLDNPAVKNKKFTVKTTFVGTEKVEDKELWKVKQVTSVETDADGNKTSLDMTCWLDPSNGQLIKMEGDVKDIPTQFGPLSWKMKMALLKGDKK